MIVKIKARYQEPEETEEEETEESENPNRPACPHCGSHEFTFTETVVFSGEAGEDDNQVWISSNSSDCTDSTLRCASCGRDVSGEFEYDFS